MQKIIYIFLLFTTSIFAQFLEYQNSFGDFNSASSFYLTSNGFFYVTDFGKDEIFMIDTLGNEIKSFGGYGWDDNSFDDPADIFADPLSVYVADKNNHAIKRFDKNLNYISLLRKRDSDNIGEQFGYPISCATSNQGDLYFIDSDNKRIMKFDIFGNFISSFGGLDAGKYQLKDPRQLAISSSNNIYVIDDNSIVYFDHYGNGINKIELSFQPASIRILFDHIVISSERDIYIANLRSIETKLNKVDFSGFKIDKVISAIYFNSKLYVLTDNAINVFAKLN